MWCCNSRALEQLWFLASFGAVWGAAAHLVLEHVLLEVLAYILQAKRQQGT
jgi:hypothetical protein